MTGTSSTPPLHRRGFLRRTAGALGAFALAPEIARGVPLALPEPMDVAVVGCGRQGRAILAELAKIEGLTVAAICDTSAGRLRSGGRRAKGARSYATVAELLEKEPAAVAIFVATPTHTHREVATACLEAGRHVFCESPLASTIEDCRALVAASRASDRVFQVGMQGRTNPIYDLARSFVRSGAIRDVISMRGQYHDPRKSSWRVPVSDPAEERALNWKLDPAVSLGLVGEVGVQQFDVFDWFLNEYPVAARATGSIQMHDDGRELPDTVHVELEWPRGRRMNWEATLANSFEGTYELFHGTMGTIKLAETAGWMFKEADAPTLGFEVYANREQFHNEQGITLIADATKLAAQGRLKEGVGLPNPPVYYALEAFLKSIAEGVKVEATAAEGMRAFWIAEATNRALASGETVAIDWDAVEKG